MKRISCLALLRRTWPERTSDELTALVLCKNIYVDGELVTDPKQSVSPGSSVDIIYPRYVSRGGCKLEEALRRFKVDVTGLTAIDAGSSTGGFTDCLLQNGAQKVYSIDVGFNLLDYRLRTDSRVAVCEKTNIMEFSTACDIAVADLSFRSIHGAASHMLDLSRSGLLIALIKPQFELRGQIDGFEGVVKDKGLLLEIVTSVYDQLCAEGLGVHDLCQSPIKGRKGNTEFLFLIGKKKGMDREGFLEALRSQAAFLEQSR